MAELFYRIILRVDDLKRAVRFYAAVLEDEGWREPPGSHLFQCGSLFLVLYDPVADGNPDYATPSPGHLHFLVVDLEAAYHRVQHAGGTLRAVEHPGGIGRMDVIAARPWGERNFYAFDPFGTPLTFADELTVLGDRMKADAA